MMSSTTLMIFIDVIYSRLSESVIRDEDFLMINIITKRFLSYFIQKFVSFIFYVSDIWMLYWFRMLFNWWKYCSNVDIQFAFFLCTTINRWRRFLKSKLRSRNRLTQKRSTRAAFKFVSRSTKLTTFSTSLSVNDMFFSFMHMM